MSAANALPIVIHPDSQLREQSVEVTEFDEALARQLEQLRTTLAEHGGIGLSAPQVGLLKRVVLIDLSEGSEPAQLFINPRIVAEADPGIVEESCLSVPGVVGNVIRATRVKVTAQDERGHVFDCELEAMAAVCLQHEIDHLDGKLFIDRLNPLRRLWLRATGMRRRPPPSKSGLSTGTPTGPAPA